LQEFACRTENAIFGAAGTNHSVYFSAPAARPPFPFFGIGK
jgi:hypothetical protein